MERTNLTLNIHTKHGVYASGCNIDGNFGVRGICTLRGTCILLGFYILETPTVLFGLHCCMDGVLGMMMGHHHLSLEHGHTDGRIVHLSALVVRGRQDTPCTLTQFIRFAGDDLYLGRG